MPSLSEQVEKKLFAQKEFLDIEEQKLSQLRKDIGLDVADQNSLLRHQIAGPFLNVRNSVKKVKSILEKQFLTQNPDLFSLKLDETAKLNLGKYFEILERDLSIITEMTQKKGIEIELTEINTSKIDIIELLNIYFSEINEKSNKYFEARMVIYGDDDDDIDETYEEDGLTTYGSIKNKIFVKGDKNLIRIAFDNLIENAVIHAFDSNYSIKNYITIRAMAILDRMEFVIVFINSGNPVPTDFDLRTFTQKGKKAGKNAGDGIGLWYVNEIMQKHGGELKYYAEYNPNEVSAFELVFPIEIENIYE